MASVVPGMKHVRVGQGCKRHAYGGVGVGIYAGWVLADGGLRGYKESRGRGRWLSEAVLEKATGLAVPVAKSMLGCRWGWV